MSNVYVTESHYYGYKSSTTNDVQGSIYTEAVGIKSTFYYDPQVTPMTGKGDLLISVIGGMARLSVTDIGNWYGTRNEYGIDNLDNASRANTSPPVSGYFATQAEAEANTVVNQFGLWLEPTRDNGTIWVITKNANGTFKKYPWSMQTINQSLTRGIDWSDLPAAIGVFRLTPEGNTPALHGSGDPILGSHGAVHAAGGKTVVPDAPIKPIVASTPLTPADKNTDQAGTSSGEHAGFVGGGWYLSNIVSGRRSGRR